MSEFDVNTNIGNNDTRPKGDRNYTEQELRDIYACIQKAHSHSHLSATRMRCAQVGLKCE